MDTHLHLAPHVTPLFIEDGAVIEAEDGFQVTRDPALRAVLLVLATSPHSRAGLAAALPPNFDPASVHDAVATLIAEGILLELPAPLSPAASAWGLLVAGCSSMRGSCSRPRGRGTRSSPNR